VVVDPYHEVGGWVGVIVVDYGDGGGALAD